MSMSAHGTCRVVDVGDLTREAVSYEELRHYMPGTISTAGGHPVMVCLSYGRRGLVWKRVRNSW